jgi:hypothetical protein
MPTAASIELLSPERLLPRSSHSIALIDGTIYILGGEVVPREPASPFIHAFSLKGIPTFIAIY